MSRLLSSATPSYDRSTYSPLRDSRHSLDSTPEEEDIDPDSTSTSHHPSQDRHGVSVGRPDSLEQTHGQGHHILATDSEEDSEDDSSSNVQHQKKKVPTVISADGDDGIIQRENSGDSTSTIVSIESPHPPKYHRESFEFAEPGLNTSQGHPEACLRSLNDNNGSDSGLWAQ
ncbi:hypothetical protein BGZ65_011160, partial [Modicella reniformis]